jgi:hypothetical protein
MIQNRAEVTVHNPWIHEKRQASDMLTCLEV